MKKRGLLFLTLAALGCSLGLATVAMAATGTAMGMKDEITVEVELDGGTITAVNVTGCNDTNVIKDAAIESVPARIVEQQNVDVDVVAGATMTSLGIRGAVKDALKNAGLDPADYSKGSDAVAEKSQGEDVECDIVIVGGGVSGMSAALQAKRDGVERVLLLEKEGYTGGSSLVCGGGIWVINTPFNEEISVNSTLEEFIGFLKTRSEGKELNEALLTQVYEVAGDVGTFLMENGLPYSKETWSLGHPDSKLPVIWSVHNEEAPWESGESGYFESVARMAADHGVEVRLDSKVTGLAHDGQRVTGVLVEDKESVYTVHAGKVILATGGFTRNRDLVAEYAPDFANAFPMTGAGSNGEGIAMAEELGAVMTGEGMMGLMGTNMNYGYYGEIGNPMAFIDAQI